MFRKLAFLMDAENGDGGNGGGGGEGNKGGGVDAATARTFLADFAHDPEALKTLPDEKVVEWHGRVTSGIDKVRPASGGKWPDKWRDELAGGDEKARQRLERFAAPTDIFKSFRALEQRVSSGDLKANVPFPEKGTAEEQTAWRKEQGVPETHDKYELKLPEGFVIGEADKPLVDGFLKDMHADNASPAAVNRAVNWFFKNRDTQMKANQEATSKVRQETEDALRGEWGNDYRKNDDVIDGLLSETLADEELRKDIADARKLNPGLSKWLLGVALQLNPAGTILPNTGGNTVQAISDEITSLKKMMGDQNSEYWKGPKATANQARYRELTAAKDRLDKKAA